MILTLLLALFALPLLLYLPGWLVSRALPGFAPADALECHYERIVISALWSGWLTLLLATFGVFSLTLQLGLTLLLCAALWLLRRPPQTIREGREEREGSIQHQSGSRQRFFTFSQFSILNSQFLFLLVLLLALLLVSRPFETVLGARDAGVYANTGFALARTGSIFQPDALVADMGQAALSDDGTVRGAGEQGLTNFLGVQERDRYLATRLRAAGFFVNEGEAASGVVVPQFLHLFPAWIGLLTAVGGLPFGLVAPGLLGLLGAWSVGMLGRRLVGPTVGLLALLFLALNGAQIWFSRYSTAETAAQFLTFAGLYFFAKWQQHPRTENREPRTSAAVGAVGVVGAVDTTRQPANPPTRQNQYGSWFYPLLCGLAIGQIALTRIDFFLLLPVVLFLGYSLITRRWTWGHTAVTVGLAAMLLHAALHIIFVARAYFFDTGHDRFQDYAIIASLVLPLLTPEVRAAYEAALAARPGRIWRELALLGGGMLVLLALWRWPQPIRFVEQQLLHWRRTLLAASALAIVLLAGWAYLLRPEIIDSDMLLNTRGGWNDPLTRDPQQVLRDVNDWRMPPETARNQAGVVILGDVEWQATVVDEAATAKLRAELQAARGPWRGPFSNQSFNWLRLQGYVGAPIALPRVTYDKEVEWWRTYAENVPPGVTPPPGIPVTEKYTIPLANMVRVGWYLSPLGVVLGVLGFALWCWRGMNRASWLLLLLALVSSFFWIRQTYGTSDQTYIYILRRFVPVVYPAFSLGMAYAIVALAGVGKNQEPRTKNRVGMNPVFALRRLPLVVAGGLTLVLAAFFLWTNRPIMRHVEYAGAVQQLDAAAARFTPGRDVLLLRGGGPTHGQSRDVPDLVATPLRFAYGIDALTVKSSQPGRYADALATLVRRWQTEGRTVYLGLSASGGSFVLPGFALEPTGSITLDVPEFEQLENQKPQNVARLALPFSIYRLVPTSPGELGTATPPLTTASFAAQLQGFFLPETGKDGTNYAWTDGRALLRLPWNGSESARTLVVQAAGGARPERLGPAQLCLAAQPETAPWPQAAAPPTPLGCVTLRNEMASYR
ncbi:MAG: hypothetical protein MUD01_25500, partial [Chloroflexaceae bacterium]|nr:hypothetical protein [Chloroflexaceae bacterium]